MLQNLCSGNPVPILPVPEATEANAMGTVLGGVSIDVSEVVLCQTKRFAKLKLAIGTIDLLNKGNSQAQVGYIAADYFVDKLGTPSPVTKCHIGVSVIYSRDAAMAAAKAGCRFFTIVAHQELCSEIMDLYPDALVVCRPYLDIRGSLPSIDYVMNKLNGARDGRLVYSGINEGEQIGQGADQMAARSQFDVELANRIKTVSGGRYAAGSFSMGAPDITRPEVCNALKQYYAPHYNSGLFWLDQHSYSPVLQHIHREDTQTIIWNGETQVIAEPEWYETRWHFYFTRCGFNPTSQSRIVSAETGLDEGGVGGFPAHNVTSQDVVLWVNRYLQINDAPITVSGSQYTSPFAGGSLFQYGDSIAWAGYDVARYHDALKDYVWLKKKVYVPQVGN